MRKKIATITRPDPTYTAALRPEIGEDPGRDKRLAPAVPIPRPTDTSDAAAEARPVSGIMPPPTQSVLPAPGDAAAITPPAPTQRKPRTPTNRKIDIRVNALERQEEALIDCGVDPAHVIRAALRRAVKGWRLAPDYAEPPEEQRSRITDWQARTSLAVDGAALAALLRRHDPLDVLSKWALVRGQIEPHVWAEIDTILAELAERPASPDDTSAGSAV